MKGYHSTSRGGHPSDEDGSLTPRSARFHEGTMSASSTAATTTTPSPSPSGSGWSPRTTDGTRGPGTPRTRSPRSPNREVIMQDPQKPWRTHLAPRSEVLARQREMEKELAEREAAALLSAQGGCLSPSDPSKPDPSKVCEKCSNVFMADAVFCRKCGHARPTPKDEKQVCACGNIFMADAVFCRKCGSPRAEAPRTAPPEVQSTKAPVAVRAQKVHQPNTEQATPTGARAPRVQHANAEQVSARPSKSAFRWDQDEVQKAAPPPQVGRRPVMEEGTYVERQATPSPRQARAVQMATPSPTHSGVAQMEVSPQHLPVADELSGARALPRTQGLNFQSLVDLVNFTVYSASDQISALADRHGQEMLDMRMHQKSAVMKHTMSRIGSQQNATLGTIVFCWCESAKVEKSARQAATQMACLKSAKKDAVYRALQSKVSVMSESLQQTVFHSWNEVMMIEKVQQEAKAMIHNMQEDNKQMMVRSMLAKLGLQTEQALVAVLHSWHEHAMIEKAEREAQAQISRLQNEQRKEKVAALLSKIGLQSESFKALVFMGWSNIVKEQIMEREAQAKLDETLKTQEAEELLRTMMLKMGALSEKLLAVAFQAWKASTQEEHRERNEAQKLMESTHEKQQTMVRSLMMKLTARAEQFLGLIVHVWHEWMREERIEREVAAQMSLMKSQQKEATYRGVVGRLGLQEQQTKAMIFRSMLEFANLERSERIAAAQLEALQEQKRQLIRSFLAKLNDEIEEFMHVSLRSWSQAARSSVLAKDNRAEKLKLRLQRHSDQLTGALHETFHLWKEASELAKAVAEEVNARKVAIEAERLLSRQKKEGQTLKLGSRFEEQNQKAMMFLAYRCLMHWDIFCREKHDADAKAHLQMVQAQLEFTMNGEAALQKRLSAALAQLAAQQEVRHGRKRPLDKRVINAVEMKIWSDFKFLKMHVLCNWWRTTAGKVMCNKCGSKVRGVQAG
eukprot:TRINITY_DN74059_c0_g1_i1.p1 TRINITY_DN74059_c0_g1~~TRINITY_DN74059_c0_g1_i1.p1  ORF type:complete len:965 (-),score=190.94 TRINITY_DN74059_c0_g1_i1:67-2961(-)